MSPDHVLSSRQRYLLDGVHSQGKYRLRRALRQSGLHAKEKKTLKRVARDIVIHEKARIAINFDLRLRVNRDTIAEAIQDCGRLLNAFELQIAFQDTSAFALRQRIMKEFILFGGPKRVDSALANLPDDERPYYGILDYLGDPLKFRGMYYGLYRLVLKPEFLERSTFTPRDSFDIESEEVFCWEHIEGVLSAHPNPLDPMRWYEYVYNHKAPSLDISLPAYIESQIFGPIFLTDIEKIWYPAHDKLDPWFMTVLQLFEDNYQIQIAHY